MSTTTTLRPLHAIAREALADPSLKGNARVYAEPYLRALTALSTREDNYYADSGDSCIRYALVNLQAWRGETARTVKAELKAHLA
jgi:hypothetical protein